MLRNRILNEFQQSFPLCSKPYAAIAEKLGCDEETVLSTIKELKEDGSISRVGAIFPPNTISKSTLAAISVPQDKIEEVAEFISSFKEVTHNYEREHEFNLWFVVNASDQDGVEKTLKEIENHTGLEVLNLPMVKGYHINLGFPLK